MYFIETTTFVVTSYGNNRKLIQIWRQKEESREWPCRKRKAKEEGLVERLKTIREVKSNQEESLNQGRKELQEGMI